jgi:hypothetical protein
MTEAELVYDELVKRGWLPPSKVEELQRSLAQAVEDANKFRQIAKWNHDALMRREPQ